MNLEKDGKTMNSKIPSEPYIHFNTTVRKGIIVRHSMLIDTETLNVQQNFTYGVVTVA